MPKTVKIDDELVSEIEQYSEEEDCDNFTHAVNEALYDYFDFEESDEDDLEGLDNSDK
jgi:hypothetical protein